MKTTSRLALIAASGMLLGAAMTPANAADLGGGCCADLEERVAELEATTARKGNRVVSLQIYGQVNKGLLIWDDGIQSDAYVVDNEVSNSRFGFKGKAKIAPGWTAGYNMEIAVSDSNTETVTQGPGGDEADARVMELRQNYWYIESDKLGRISVGQQSDAADGAAEVVLGNSMRNSGVVIGSGLSLRLSNGNMVATSATANVTLNSFANNLDGTRRDLVRYDSPSVYGFVLSTSWGENDYADVALRFKREFSNIRLVAGIGYAWATDNTNDDVEELLGSVSVMHVPTGLYVAFSAASRDFQRNLNNKADDSMWYVQAGIEKKFNSLGATTFYGEYGNYSDMASSTAVTLTGSDATRWGLGVNQKIDSAAMDIYANATFWSFDDDQNRSYEDMSTFMIGSRIQF